MYRKFMVRAKEHGIDLKLELGEGPLCLEADEDRMEQVLTNLLDNAFRHTPEGGTIGISAATLDGEPGNELHISIKDSGVGIPSDDLPFIFERFYKADKARVRGEERGNGTRPLHREEHHRRPSRLDPRRKRRRQRYRFHIALPVETGQ
ncbi:hypothetical protein HMSSN036_04070 [Paenibacillus macerans]|nr:hypothetical protein HMSSN036_04070 [Paenibacillus macerans]